jgi:two-component system NtrC family sensor kinase
MARRTPRPPPPRMRVARRRPTPSAIPTAAPKSKRRRAPYPLLEAEEVLRSIVAFSREVSADMGEEELFQLFHRTVRELLPNRMVAVRRIDPRTLIVAHILAEDELVPNAARLPPLTPGAEGRVIDERRLIFREAAAGFAVPLLAGGELTGEVHVNYRAVSDARGGYPVTQDEGLIIPIANHVAVVAHTRRLLRETAYLQHYLEQLIDQANFLIIAADLAGRVTVWNRAMNKLTGFSRNQAVGRELLPWLTQLGAPDIALVIKQVAASGEPATREVKLPSVGGAVLRAAFNVVTVRGQGGQADAILGIGQDVTALRSLQSQVIHAEKLATVGQIAAGVAHEINNPLTSIQVCAEAVLRKAQLAAQGRTPNSFDPPDIDRLKKIQEGAERIRRFAKDLVSYARPSGTEVDDVSLNEVVEQALSFCEHILEDAHARLERDLSRSLPGIQAIRDQLLQVVINLVTNAAHALGDKGGQIRVRTWPSGEASVSLAVSDSGAGIRDEDRPHVFEPFFSTKPAGRGTGLGLSVVRNIIYSHGGQISFQTRPGSGTTFVVTLPINHLVSPRTEEGDDPAI